MAFSKPVARKTESVKISIKIDLPVGGIGVSEPLTGSRLDVIVLKPHNQ